MSDIRPDSPRCRVPPACSLRISRSSHFAAFSLSDRCIRGESISRKRSGERKWEVVADDGDAECSCMVECKDPARDLRSRFRTSTLMDGRFGERGVRGVTGNGDVGVEAVGEMMSKGGGFLRELRFGLGGAPSLITPNSDVGKEYREADGVVKLFVGSEVSNVGINGEGGSDSCSVVGLPPAVWLRRGGGSDGRISLGV